MKIHFVGIGGIGMSAQALHEYFSNNNEVTGTDPFCSERVLYLKQKGIKVYNKHFHENVDNVDLVVKTPAVPDDNIEVLIAKEKNIPIISRLEHHIKILEPYTKIGITGTDGKTTTTSMVAHMLLKLKKDPTVFLGATHPMLEHGNYRKGGQIAVFEMDESQPGFENYNPDFLIITNIRGDHIENYKNLQHYHNCFENACKNVKICITNSENEIIKNSIKYGIEKGDYTIKSIEKDNFSQIVRISTPFGEKSFRLGVPGFHNVLNALSAIALLYEMGYDKDGVLDALSDFRLPSRRFQISYEDDDIIIIDDYSHTPIEIKSLLLTAKETFKNKKINIIFQPHRYSRLKREWKKFSEVLSIADKVYITEVYSAFELKDGISAKLIAEKIDKAIFVKEKDELLNILSYDPGVYIFAGAGDIIEVSKKFRDKVGGLKI